MLTFISRALTSGFGAAVAIAVYIAVTGTMTGRVADSHAITVNSLILGGIFGLIFAVAHIRKEPHVMSSNMTALFFTACLCALFIWADTFPPFSPMVATALVVFTVATGTTGYYTMRLYQRICK